MCLLSNIISTATPGKHFFHTFSPDAGQKHYLTLFIQSELDETILDGVNLNLCQPCLYMNPSYILRSLLWDFMNCVFQTASHISQNAVSSFVEGSVESSNEIFKQIWASRE